MRKYFGTAWIAALALVVIVAMPASAVIENQLNPTQTKRLNTAVKKSNTALKMSTNLRVRVTAAEQGIAGLRTAPNVGPRGDTGSQGSQGVQGLRGATGATGATGGFDLASVEQIDGPSSSVAPGSYGFTEAICDRGSRAIGGGYYASNRVEVNQARPVQGNLGEYRDRYVLSVTNNGGTTGYFSANVVCARP